MQCNPVFEMFSAHLKKMSNKAFKTAKLKNNRKKEYKNLNIDSYWTRIPLTPETQ